MRISILHDDYPQERIGKSFDWLTIGKYSRYGVMYLVAIGMLLNAALIAQTGGEQGEQRGKLVPLPAAESQSGTTSQAPESLTSAATIRWQEAFDSQTIPVGWQIVNYDESDLLNGVESVWQYRQEVRFESDSLFVVTPQSGQSFWHSSFRNANEFGHIDEWIISPTLPVTIESGDSLFFWAGAIGGAFPDSIYVFATEPENVDLDSLPLGFFPLGEFKIAGSGSDSLFLVWEEYGVPLDSLVGDSIVIAINYYITDGGPGGSASDNVWVDNLTVENRSPLAIATNGPGHYIDEIVLHGNYPNPFNPVTTIEFQLEKAAEIRLQIYNVLGQPIRELTAGMAMAGRHRFQWNATDEQGDVVPGGIYFYRLSTADGFQLTRKMLLIK